jgi:hypothetical protein
MHTASYLGRWHSSHKITIAKTSWLYLLVKKMFFVGSKEIVNYVTRLPYLSTYREHRESCQLSIHIIDLYLYRTPIKINCYNVNRTTWPSDNVTDLYW